MREIKFRAWEEASKRMSYGERENFDDMIGWRFHHFEDDEASVILEQFTGLHDKNGREIYEGDILKGSTPLCYPVIWENEYSRFRATRKTSYIEYPMCSEVIGNIHENPELLK